VEKIEDSVSAASGGGLIIIFVEPRYAPFELYLSVCLCLCSSNILSICSVADSLLELLVDKKDDESWLAALRDWGLRGQYFVGDPELSVNMRPVGDRPGLPVRSGATAPYLFNRADSTSVLDFRFLDLSNQRCVRECESSIDDGFCSLTILMGCSGCGKTSTLFTIGSKRYCVAAFGEARNQTKDFAAVIDRSLVSTSESAVEHLFTSFVLSRIAWLFVYFAAKRISAQTWLLLQLREPFSARRFMDTKTLDFFLGLAPSHSVAILKTLQMRFQRLFGSRFFTAVDEVQVLMDKVLRFETGNQGAAVYRRLPRIWMDLPQNCEMRLVLAGTGLTNVILQAAASSIVKRAVASGYNFGVVSSFPYFSDSDVLDAMSRYFDVDPEMRKACQVLVGRARFSYSFLWSLLSGRRSVSSESAVVRENYAIMIRAKPISKGDQEPSSNAQAEACTGPEGQGPDLSLHFEAVPSGASFCAVGELLRGREEEAKSPLLKALKRYLRWHIFEEGLRPEPQVEISILESLRTLVRPPSGGAALIARERLLLLRTLMIESQTYSDRSHPMETEKERRLLHEDTTTTVPWYLSGACFIHSVSAIKNSISLSFSEPLVIAASAFLLTSGNPTLMVQSFASEWVEQLRSLSAGNTSSGCTLQDIVLWKIIAESWRNLFDGRRSYCLRDALTSLCGNHFGKPQWLTDDLLDAPLRPSQLLVANNDEMLRRLSEDRSAQLEVFLPSPMARPDGIFRFGDVLVTFACKQRARFTLKDFCDNVMSSDPRLAFLQNPVSDARRLKRFLDKAAQHSSMCVAGAPRLPFPKELPPPSDRERRERWLQILPK
jgi:hypothetical protein